MWSAYLARYSWFLLAAGPVSSITASPEKTTMSPPRPSPLKFRLTCGFA
jgi:hypothetical protein